MGLDLYFSKVLIELGWKAELLTPGADWIGGFAACYSELGELGKDYARAADELRGQQGYVGMPAGSK